MADMKTVRKQIQDVNLWRQQISGLGLIPPEVDAVLRMFDEVEGLQARKAQLEKDLVPLEARQKQSEELDKQITGKRAEPERLERAIAEFKAAHGLEKAS